MSRKIMVKPRDEKDKEDDLIKQRKVLFCCILNLFDSTFFKKNISKETLCAKVLVEAAGAC